MVQALAHVRFTLFNDVYLLSELYSNFLYAMLRDDI